MNIKASELAHIKRNFWPAEDHKEYGSCYNGMRDIEIWLPAYFYDDHVSRDLPAGQEIKRGSKGVLVFCNEAEIDEIESDASYYYDQYRTGGFCEMDLGLMSSAKATVARIAKHYLA